MKYFVWIFSFILCSCSTNDNLEIVVRNPSNLNRPYEVVEVPLDDIALILEKVGDEFIITNKNGTKIDYQITYDRKLLFPASVSAKAKATYTIQSGKPDEPRVITYGKHYPERLDDIAWENDRIAFRTYGPALQATGERAYGYDVWVKRTADLVIENRYEKELNPETQARIKELRETDPEAANDLAYKTSYHIDHGDGLDYYSVGPTLGAGTSALMVDDAIVYPYCYRDYEILDNGPLRFSVRLTYPPLKVENNDSVTETRIISLDAGSQLNKIYVSYNQLDHTTPIATGIVLHDARNNFTLDSEKGFIAYAEPKDTINGQTYIGAVFPDTKGLKEIQAEYFSDAEKKERGANGHIMAISNYQPDNHYTYYAGAGWSKWGFYAPEDWFDYIAAFAAKLKQPLIITINP